MPAVQVALPAAKRRDRRATRRRVSLSSRIGTITLDITSPVAELDDLASRYSEVDRGDDRPPALILTGSRLSRLRLEARMGLADRGDITSRLTTLIALARPIGGPAPVVLAYSPLETSRAVVRAGTWAITDLSIRTVWRRPDNDAPYRAVLSIELTESSDIAAPAAVAAAAKTATAKPLQRRHTVGDGETLRSIAATHYGGDGSNWPELAAANSIRNPSRITAGQVLILPAA